MIGHERQTLELCASFFGALKCLKLIPLEVTFNLKTFRQVHFPFYYRRLGNKSVLSERLLLDLSFSELQLELLELFTG